MTNDINILIFTALTEERDAIKKKYGDNLKKKGFHYIKTINKNSITYKIILACVNEKGSVHSAIFTMQTIQEWSPDYIILTGIAAGIKNHNRKLGDIIIAKKIREFISGRETEEGTNYDTDLFHTDTILYTAANNSKNSFSLAQSSEYLNEDTQHYNPQIYFGTVGCVDRVINSEEKLNEIFKEDSKLIAIEMEGYGIACAAEKLGKKIFLAKAISDWGYNKEAENQRAYALNVAATFIVQFIDVLIKHQYIKPVSKPTPIADSDIAPSITKLQNNKAGWLISNSNLWNDYIEILHFAKMVHFFSQSMDLHGFNLELIKNKENWEKIWSDYYIYCINILDKEQKLENFFYDKDSFNKLENILKSFTNEISKLNINKILISKINEFYKTTIDYLCDYIDIHNENKNALQQNKATLIYQDQKFQGNIIIMSEHTKKLCENADHLLKRLIEILLIS